MNNAEYDSFSAYYDLEYGHKENDLDFYLDMAEHFDSPVLEIGVGTGRVALDLALNGFEVFGVDNSRQMLDIAENKLGHFKKKLKAPVHLLCADMRDFSLQQKFTLAIIPFRAFLHNMTLQDQLDTLKNIKRHLKPQGMLALDLFVPLYSVMAQKEWHDKVEPHELAESGSGVSIDILVQHQPELQLLTIQNTYNDKAGKESHTATMKYRYIFRYEMEALLYAAGYKTVSVFGGFENQAYDFESGIMVFVAQALKGDETRDWILKK